MSVYRCNHCGKYFNEYSLTGEKQPDTEAVHDECGQVDYDELSESEIIEELNDYYRESTE